MEEIIFSFPGKDKDLRDLFGKRLSFITMRKDKKSWNIHHCLVAMVVLMRTNAMYFKMNYLAT